MGMKATTLRRLSFFARTIRLPLSACRRIHLISLTTGCWLFWATEEGLWAGNRRVDDGSDYAHHQDRLPTCIFRRISSCNDRKKYQGEDSEEQGLFHLIREDFHGQQLVVLTRPETNGRNWLTPQPVWDWGLRCLTEFEQPYPIMAREAAHCAYPAYIITNSQSMKSSSKASRWLAFSFRAWPSATKSGLSRIAVPVRQELSSGN